VTQELSIDGDRPLDISGVVGGPLGDLLPEDPSTPGPIGADVEAPPPIDSLPVDRLEAWRSIDGLPGPDEQRDQDKVGVVVD
jgi:hypothetical protein